MGVDNPFTPSILALSPDEMFGIPYSVNNTQTEQAKQGDATLAWGKNTVTMSIFVNYK